tara:strand:+ start:69 stop:311 length:243 start_codon:yes stop_codon:yes gene_type:complete
MNEVIKDIERLKEVRDQISSINGMYYTKGIIELMIEEKEIIVKTFEKNADDRSQWNLPYHSTRRGQWKSDINKILKLGEK